MDVEYKTMNDVLKDHPDRLTFKERVVIDLLKSILRRLESIEQQLLDSPNI